MRPIVTLCFVWVCRWLCRWKSGVHIFLCVHIQMVIHARNNAQFPYFLDTQRMRGWVSLICKRYAYNNKHIPTTQFMSHMSFSPRKFRRFFCCCWCFMCINICRMYTIRQTACVCFAYFANKSPPNLHDIKYKQLSFSASAIQCIVFYQYDSVKIVRLTIVHTHTHTIHTHFSLA